MHIRDALSDEKVTCSLSVLLIKTLLRLDVCREKSMVLEYSLIPTGELKLLQSDQKPVEKTIKNDFVVNVIEPEPSVEINGTHDTILENLPKTFLKRSRRILSFIEKFPHIIKIDTSGFLLIRGVLQDGSDVTDLISSLLTTIPRKFQPIGIQGFLAAMAAIKLPLALIANPKYRKMVASYSKCRDPKIKKSKKQKMKCLKYF